MLPSSRRLRRCAQTPSPYDAYAPAELGPIERSGRYALQARIAAEHVAGARFADIDWPAIAALYDRLYEQEPQPVVALNRAVARALAEEPEVGLALLDEPELAQSLADYPPYLVARADFLRRAGRNEEARSAYRAALARAATAPERAFLEARLHQLTALKEK